MAMVFTRASKEAQKQMELPLQEGKKWESLDTVPTVQFLAADIQVSPKERVTGTILFELLKKADDHFTSDTIRFISWIDQHFADAMDVLAKSIMQTARLRGITAKQEEPQLFQQDEPAAGAQADRDDPDLRPVERRSSAEDWRPEVIAENKQVTHKTLYEGWRKFLK
jgi:hypothetical protein